MEIHTFKAVVIPKAKNLSTQIVIDNLQSLGTPVKVCAAPAAEEKLGLLYLSSTEKLPKAELTADTTNAEQVVISIGAQPLSLAAISEYATSATILIINAEFQADLAAAASEVASEYLQDASAVLVYYDEKDCVLYRTNMPTQFIPAFPSPVVDNNGRWEAFLAGILNALSGGLGLEQAIGFAQYIAAGVAATAEEKIKTERA